MKYFYRLTIKPYFNHWLWAVYMLSLFNLTIHRMANPLDFFQYRIHWKYENFHSFNNVCVYTMRAHKNFLFYFDNLKVMVYEQQQLLFIITFLLPCVYNIISFWFANVFIKSRKVKTKFSRAFNFLNMYLKSITQRCFLSLTKTENFSQNLYHSIDAVKISTIYSCYMEYL